MPFSIRVFGIALFNIMSIYKVYVSFAMYGQKLLQGKKLSKILIVCLQCVQFRCFGDKIDLKITRCQ